MRWKLCESQSSQIRKWLLSYIRHRKSEDLSRWVKQLCSLVTLGSALPESARVTEWPTTSLLQRPTPWEAERGWLVWVRMGSHSHLGHTPVGNKCLGILNHDFLICQIVHRAGLWRNNNNYSYESSSCFVPYGPPDALTVQCTHIFIALDDTIRYRLLLTSFYKSQIRGTYHSAQHRKKQSGNTRHEKEIKTRYAARTHGLKPSFAAIFDRKWGNFHNLNFLIFKMEQYKN